MNIAIDYFSFKISLVYTQLLILPGLPNMPF